METPKQTIRQIMANLPETAHRGTTFLGKWLLIVAAIIITYSVGAQASSTTQPLTPQSQRSYEASRIAFCEAEKSLAQSKIADYSNGILKLTPDDLKALAEKKDKECMGF